MTTDNTVHGVSDDIIEFVEPIEVAFVVEASFDGPENFIVTAVSDHGDMLDLLVNTIGPYRGRTLYIADPSVPMLQVKGQGAWTIAVSDVPSSPRWDGRTPMSGVSDEVLFLPDPISRFTPVTFSTRTEDNVIVIAYSDDEWDVVVNEIGDYEGTVGLKPGVRIVQIKTEGPWELAAR